MSQFDHRHSSLYDPFDFLVLSYGRLGTLSLWQYLNYHHALTVPDFDTTDKYLLGNHHYSVDEVLKNADGHGVGLIVHGHSYGRNIFERAEEIVRWVRPGVAFQCVRNPLSHMLSCYNTQIKMGVIGRYIKDKIYLPLSEKVTSRPPVCALPEFITRNIDHVLYDELNERYSKHFKRVRLIEFSDFSNAPQRTVEGMLDELGIEKSICPERIYLTPRHTDQAMIMRFAAYGFEFEQQIIRGGFFYDDSWLIPRYYNVKLGSIAASVLPDFLQYEEPAQTPSISFRFHRIGWEKLSELTRREIIEGGFFERMVMQIFYPRWLERVSVILAELIQHIKPELCSMEKAMVLNLARDDLAGFVKKYPGLKDQWEL